MEQGYDNRLMELKSAIFRASSLAKEIRQDNEKHDLRGKMLIKNCYSVMSELQDNMEGLFKSVIQEDSNDEITCISCGS